MASTLSGAVSIAIVLINLSLVVKSSGQVCRATDVVIIGAGAAGIAAADTFHRHGKTDFVVLEGKAYVGGRMYNQWLAGINLPIGAGWIHMAETNHSMWKLMRKNSMNYYKDSYERIYRDITTSSTSKATKETQNLELSIQNAGRLMATRLTAKESDIPLAVALSMSGWTPNTNLEKAVQFWYIPFENGVHPDKHSAWQFGFTGYYKDEYIVTDPRGYGFPIRKEAEKFQSKVHLNKTVTRVSKIPSQLLYEVRTSDGSCYRGRDVLVTVSSGVLNANAIAFVPALPEWKQHALQMFPMGHYCKTFLEFDNQFWDSSPYTMLVTERADEYTHIQNFKPLTGKNLIQITTVDEFCKYDQLKSDSELVQSIMKVLRRAYGNHIPNPKGMLRSKWSQDPLVQGAYSYLVPGVTDSDFRAIKHPVEHIWFAGEYTSSKYWGYAQGAYDEGVSRAEQILACRTDPSKCPAAFAKENICSTKVCRDRVPKWCEMNVSMCRVQIDYFKEWCPQTCNFCGEI